MYICLLLFQIMSSFYHSIIPNKDLVKRDTILLPKLCIVFCQHINEEFLFQCPGLTACHEKRGPHEAPGKSAKTPGTKICPYSHPSSQNSNGSSAGNPLSTSADLCKTTPKHFKTMCRRPTPPGNTTLTQGSVVLF